MAGSDVRVPGVELLLLCVGVPHLRAAAFACRKALQEKNGVTKPSGTKKRMGDAFGGEIMSKPSKCKLAVRVDEICKS